MNAHRWDRLAAGGGVLGAILMIVGLIVIGTPPAVDDPASEVQSWFASNRDSVLIGTFIVALGVLAILWYFGALLHAMMEVGERRLAMTAGAGFLLGFSAGAVATLMRAGLAYGAAEELSAGNARAVYWIAGLIDVMSTIFLAAFAAGVGVAIVRGHLLARWLGWASLAVAIVFLVASTAWATSGGWSPTGWIMTVAYITFLGWTIVTSGMLTARHEEHVVEGRPILHH